MRRINPGRFRYASDDPMRELHVPRRERLDEDPEDGSDDGREPVTLRPGTDELDRDEIRQRGDVVSQRDLT